jgi:hypothetical protein
VQVFVEEKLRETLERVPDLKKAEIFTPDPLASRFHLLKNQRYTNRADVMLEPDALYIRPVCTPPATCFFWSMLVRVKYCSHPFVQSTQWFGQQGNGQGDPAKYQTRPCYAHGIWVCPPARLSFCWRGGAADV